VVYGKDRMDEVSLSAPSTVCELRDGFYRTTTIAPEDFGLARCNKEDLLGGTPMENATCVRAILAGYDRTSKRDAALLNAGCALYVAKAAPDIAAGIELARAQIENGNAIQTLDALIEGSNR
jgi:anthranilate phosphoribosyltransferase